MEKKKIVVVGCSSENGQYICRELATSECADIVAGFDTMFSTALTYPFKTCVTVDELKNLSIDIIVSSNEMPDDIQAFALSNNITIFTIKDANAITKALEEYL